MTVSDGTTGINEDLVRKYHEAGDIKNLLSVFDFMYRQMHRAESLSRAYLAQMITLQKHLDEERSKTERPKPPVRVEVERTSAVPSSKPATSPSSSSPSPSRKTKGDVIDIEI